MKYYSDSVAVQAVRTAMRTKNTYLLTYLLKGVKVKAAECHVAGEMHQEVEEMKEARLIGREWKTMIVRNGQERADDSAFTGVSRTDNLTATEVITATTRWLPKTPPSRLLRQRMRIDSLFQRGPSSLPPPAGVPPLTIGRGHHPDCIVRREIRKWLTLLDSITGNYGCRIRSTTSNRRSSTKCHDIWTRCFISNVTTMTIAHVTQT